jgi:hypothetical protein
MKSKLITLAAAVALSAGMAFAIDTPPAYRNASRNQQWQTCGNCDSTGAKRGNADMGKKTGPRDGSGPIHEPGTGGGNGGGQRRGGRR